MHIDWKNARQLKPDMNQAVLVQLPWEEDGIGVFSTMSWSGQYWALETQTAKVYGVEPGLPVNKLRHPGKWAELDGEAFQSEIISVDSLPRPMLPVLVLASHAKRPNVRFLTILTHDSVEWCLDSSVAQIYGGRPLQGISNALVIHGWGYLDEKDRNVAGEDQ